MDSNHRFRVNGELSRRAVLLDTRQPQEAANRTSVATSRFVRFTWREMDSSYRYRGKSRCADGAVVVIERISTLFPPTASESAKYASYHPRRQ